MKTIIVPVGLPGSGKTTFLKTLANKDAKYIDVDEFFRHNNKNQTYLYDNIKSYINYMNSLILDGLFLSDSDIVSFIKKLRLTTLTRLNHISLLIYYWKEDKDACIWNDKYRRDISSTHSIKTKELEEIDVFNISERLNVECNLNATVTMVEKSIIRKPEYKMFSDKFKLQDKLKSESWATGGTRNSWDNYSHDVSVQPACNFVEFDELLLKINPNMPYLIYSHIYNSCVILDNYSDKDYYGGCVYYNQYVCDIQKLYNKLVEYYPDVMDKIINE